MRRSSHRENNHFHRIIHNEPNFTDLFCNLFSYKIFRDHFIEIINERIKENKLNSTEIYYNNFDTEISLSDIEKKNQSRADLVLTFNESKKIIFEIKIKRHTPLTKNQPDAYIDYLEKENRGGIQNLFFIVPKYYAHEEKIKERFYEYCNNKTSSEVKNFKPDDQIIYWEEIIHRIEKAELHKLNSFINEFYKFCTSWFIIKKIIFSQLEKNMLDATSQKEDKEILKMSYDTNIPKLITKLVNIIDSIKNDLHKGFKKETDNTFYGYAKDITYNDTKYHLWFGMDYDIWEKHNFPICIQLIISKDEGEESSLHHINNIPVERVDEEDSDAYYLVQLDKKIYDEDFNEYVVKFLHSISQTI